MPGTTVSAVVETAHVEPIVVSGVAVHGTVTDSGVSCTVPGWSSGKIGGSRELLRSVIRSVTCACSSPV